MNTPPKPAAVSVRAVVRYEVFSSVNNSWLQGQWERESEWEGLVKLRRVGTQDAIIVSKQSLPAAQVTQEAVAGDLLAASPVVLEEVVLRKPFGAVVC